MGTARQLSVLMTVLVMALLAWHLLGGRRDHDAPRAAPGDADRRRRFRIGWEVRALVVGVSGPLAAAIWFGYVPSDYALPLALFLMAGLLLAERIGPSRLRNP